MHEVDARPVQSKPANDPTEASAIPVNTTSPMLVRLILVRFIHYFLAWQ